MSDDPQRRDDGFVARGLTLAALCSFALVQPLLAMLADDATFFVAHRSGTADLVLFVLTLAVAPPALLLAAEGLLGLMSVRARSALHLLLIGSLVALTVAPALDRSFASPIVALGVPAVVGLASALAYRAWPPARTLIRFLSPAPLVFAAVFFLTPDVARIVRAGDALPLATPNLTSPGDVVLVIFDELPITTLMADEDTIDANLFPNFARLAATSTWFRNATAVHDFTNHAVPAILTGLRPDEALSLPVASNHPRSLFTLLGSTHRLRVRETLTAVCPPELIGDVRRPSFGIRFGSLVGDAAVVLAHIVLPNAATGALPPINRQWQGFWGDAEGDGEVTFASIGVGNVRIPVAVARNSTGSRVGQFREFVATIDTVTDPTLWVHHVMLPHMEWIYFPTGTMYLATRNIPGLRGGGWTSERWPRTVALQRHLAQTGMVDRMLGELLDALEVTGRLAAATIVVTADHGVSFAVGSPQREAVTGNLNDIMRVPLFIKRPGQTQGEISDRNVEAIDIVPTLVDVLGGELPWPVDGDSVYGTDERTTKTMARLRDETLTIPGTPPPAWPTLATKLELFGAGATWDDVFGVGDVRGLVGRRLSDLDITPHDSTQIHVEGLPRYAAVRTRSGVLPSLVEGHVTGSDIPRHLAIATRGTIRAVASTYGQTSGRAEFVALLPEGALVDGDNELQILAVDGKGALRRMMSRSYRLEHDVLVLPDGRRLDIASASGGQVRTATRQESLLHLTGWAGNAATARPADTVLVFQDGRHVDSGPTGAPIRRMGEETRSWNAGFELMIPPDLLASPPDGRLRVVALIDDVAYELSLGPDASWIGP